MKYVKISFLLVLGLLAAKEARLQDSNVIYRTNDNGSNWNPVTEGLPAGVLINEFLPFQGKIIAATNDHGLFVSKEGTKWEPIGQNLPKKIKALARNGNTLIAGLWKSGIMVSFDGGETWQNRNFGLYDLGLEVMAITSLDKLVYVGTADGVFVSWNNGQVWMNVLEDVQVNDLEVKGSSIYAASPIGVFRSDDHGKTWNNILEGVEVSSVHCVDHSLYALSYREGILRKSEEGNSWERFSDGLPDKGRSSFALSAAGNTLWLGHRGNIYRLKAGEKTWKKLPMPWEENIAVFQIFPFGASGILVALGGGC